jgi:hypothetical protein
MSQHIEDDCLHTRRRENLKYHHNIFLILSIRYARWRKIDALYGGYVRPCACLIKFSTGILHHKLMFEFNFGSKQSSITPILHEAPNLTLVFVFSKMVHGTKIVT